MFGTGHSPGPFQALPLGSISCWATDLKHRSLRPRLGAVRKRDILQKKDQTFWETRPPIALPPGGAVHPSCCLCVAQLHHRPHSMFAHTPGGLLAEHPLFRFSKHQANGGVSFHSGEDTAMGAAFLGNRRPMSFVLVSVPKLFFCPSIFSHRLPRAQRRRRRLQSPRPWSPLAGRGTWEPRPHCGACGEWAGPQSRSSRGWLAPPQPQPALPPALPHTPAWGG